MTTEKDLLRARMEGRKEALEQAHIKARSNVVAVLRELESLSNSLPGVNATWDKADVARQAYKSSMRVLSQRFFEVEPEALLVDEMNKAAESFTPSREGFKRLAQVVGYVPSAVIVPIKQITAMEHRRNYLTQTHGVSTGNAIKIVKQYGMVPSPCCERIPIVWPPTFLESVFSRPIRLPKRSVSAKRRHCAPKQVCFMC